MDPGGPPPAPAEPHAACDRRALLHWAAGLAATCGTGAPTAAQAQSPPPSSRAPSAVPVSRLYARSRLVDTVGRPFKGRQLTPGQAHIFPYPYRTTPVFLVALPQAAAPVDLTDGERRAYRSLPGVGPARSIVAFSAICPHKLMYPTPAISFINLRKGGAGEPSHVVHCCGDNSRYDPTQGGKVMSGPAPQPLAMVLLEWDAASDDLHAVGTVGGEMFQAFFDKYAFRLNLDHGALALEPSGATAVVQPAAQYSRQLQSCKA